MILDENLSRSSAAKSTGKAVRGLVPGWALAATGLCRGWVQAWQRSFSMN